jgi:hypothetical protein
MKPTHPSRRSATGPGAFAGLLGALMLLSAGSCASLTIEMPRQVTLRAGDEAEIVGALVDARTPVGGVDVAKGRLPPGLALEFVREASSFTVRGVPSESGRYEVTISAWTYGTNFPGDRATVTLFIDVVE